MRVGGCWRAKAWMNGDQSKRSSCESRISVVFVVGGRSGTSYEEKDGPSLVTRRPGNMKWKNVIFQVLRFLFVVNYI